MPDTHELWIYDETVNASDPIPCTCPIGHDHDLLEVCRDADYVGEDGDDPF